MSSDVGHFSRKPAAANDAPRSLVVSDRRCSVECSRPRRRCWQSPSHGAARRRPRHNEHRLLCLRFFEGETLGDAIDGRRAFVLRWFGARFARQTNGDFIDNRWLTANFRRTNPVHHPLVVHQKWRASTRVVRSHWRKCNGSRRRGCAATSNVASLSPNETSRSDRNFAPHTP